ncbi:hypothetical protein D9M68_733610 [compost metagenome]
MPDWQSGVRGLEVLLSSSLPSGLRVSVSPPGESLLSVAKEVTKNACPDIRPGCAGCPPSIAAPGPGATIPLGLLKGRSPGPTFRSLAQVPRWLQDGLCHADTVTPRPPGEGPGERAASGGTKPTRSTHTNLPVRCQPLFPERRRRTTFSLFRCLKTCKRTHHRPLPKRNRAYALPYPIVAKAPSCPDASPPSASRCYWLVPCCSPPAAASTWPTATST